MRFALAIAAVLLHFAASATAGTVFVVQGTLGRGAALSGTITIDTITGSLDGIDLYVDPILFGRFPSPTLHYTQPPTTYLYPASNATMLHAVVQSGWANANLWITANSQSWVGYAGGPIRPTETVLMLWSGVFVQSYLEPTQTLYYPLSSGSISPLVVPEPGTFVMALVGGCCCFILVRRARRA